MNNVQLYQYIGESIRAFAWRINMQAGCSLSDEYWARKVVRGLNLNILYNMPKSDHPWTIGELFWLDDNLHKYLPSDDLHFSQHLMTDGIEPVCPNFTVVVNSEQDGAKPESSASEKLGSEGGKPSEENSADLSFRESGQRCFRCQMFGHKAWQHGRPEFPHLPPVRKIKPPPGILDKSKKCKKSKMKCSNKSKVNSAQVI
jgi:hypothetical protein